MLRFGVGLLALSVAMASPALASDKKDFEVCDGRAHPGKQDDGMRGEPSRPAYFSSFNLGTNNVAACTRALASPRLLPTQTVRRAHLLRARAAAHLRAGDHAKALQDLDLAAASAADRAADPFYRRSMGVSLDLMRAVALAQTGETDRARALAQAAVAARPYSLQIQRLGAEILHSLGVSGTEGRSLWSGAYRLEPEMASSALMREAELGNFAGVLALRNGMTLAKPAPAGPQSLLGLSGLGGETLTSILVGLHAAYARAATGDPKGARSELDDAQARARAAFPATAAANGLTQSFGKVVNEAIDNKAKQVEARIAVAEGRHADAIAALVGMPMPKDAAAIELLSALKAAAPPNNVALVPDVAPFKDEVAKLRRERLTRLLPSALLAPETPRAVVDYDRARPNILAAVVGGALSMGTSLLGGISRTDGFRSTVNADGTTKVEFVGNTPSASLVQEMTLLRAAELTRAAGKRAFVIVDRKDFTRTMQMSRGGVPISSTANGYKTELVIRYVERPAADPRALDAIVIIDSLGPLYYEEKAKA